MVILNSHTVRFGHLNPPHELTTSTCGVASLHGCPAGVALIVIAGAACRSIVMRMRERTNGETGCVHGKLQQQQQLQC